MRVLLIMIVLFFVCIEIGNPQQLNRKCDFIIENKVTQITQVIDSITQIDGNSKIQYMTIDQFKDSLGKFESNYSYSVVNKYGFKGKYQFSNYMIKRFARVTPSEFLNSSTIQERTMTKVCKYYIKYIYQYGYDKYINKEIKGVIITMEGLMLGVHFSPLYLHEWLTSNGGINRGDCNITIHDYIQKFENKGIIVSTSILSCN